MIIEIYSLYTYSVRGFPCYVLYVRNRTLLLYFNKIKNYQDLYSIIYSERGGNLIVLISHLKNYSYTELIKEINTSVLLHTFLDLNMKYIHAIDRLIFFFNYTV